MLIRRYRDFNSFPTTAALERVKHKLAEPSTSIFQTQEDFDSFPVIEWQNDADFPDYNMSPCTTKQRAICSLKHLAPNPPNGEVSHHGRHHGLLRSRKVKSSLSMLASEIITSPPNYPAMPFGNHLDTLFPLDVQQGENVSQFYVVA
jgi:hypothetical protein